jgi:hypothetical protein
MEEIYYCMNLKTGDQIGCINYPGIPAINYTDPTLYSQDGLHHSQVDEIIGSFPVTAFSLSLVMFPLSNQHPPH